MKILHTADLHLDTPFSLRSPEQSQYLKEQLLTVPQRLSDLCRQEQCDLFLLSGDLFDGPWTRDSFFALRDALEDCGAAVFISPGNHDYVNLKSPYTTELWPSNVHIFSQPRMESCLLKELDCRVYGAGFRSMDCGGVLEGFCREQDARYHIGILHGDPTRLDSPCCPVTAEQIQSCGLDYLALGHIHKSGQLRQGRTLCAWPGCPMGRGFDETGHKGALLVTLQEEAQARFIPLGMPCFFEEKAEPKDLQRLLPAIGSRDFYRITLVGDDSRTSVEELYQQYRRFPHLEFRDHRRVPTDLWGCASSDTPEGLYFRILKDAFENSDADTGEIIELAARLSRQILDGQEVILP